MNVRTSYDRNNYEFSVNNYVGMPGDFQHVMTSVTLFKDIFVPISYINHLMKKKYIIYM